MKIKKIKLTTRLREIYNNLKQRGITITPEIETMVSIVDKKISEIIVPSVLFETFDIKDAKIQEVKNQLEIPKNVGFISFILVTLGKEVDSIIEKENEEINKMITDVVLTEYLNAGIRFVYKILEEQTEENFDLSSVFIVHNESYDTVFKLLDTQKIGVSYNSSTFSPKYSSINYLFWFRKRK